MKPPFSPSNKGLLEVRALSPDELRPALNRGLWSFSFAVLIEVIARKNKEKGLAAPSAHPPFVEGTRDSFLLLVARQGSFLCLPSTPFVGRPWFLLRIPFVGHR